MSLSHACLLLAVSLFFGCASKKIPPVPPEQKNYFISELQTYIVPPVGWSKPDIEHGDDYVRYVWVSPTDGTAVGVIRFSMPLPVGYDIAVWGFMEEMKAREGSAELIQQSWDIESQAMRFVADGGLYRVRVKMIVSGFNGWAIFAGTKTDRPINEDDLKKAIIARDSVRVLNN